MDDISIYITVAPVASAIFAVTLACSLLAFYTDEVYTRFILHPYSVSRGQNVFTLITSGLIHKDFSHLFFNMFSFYFFAFELETRMGHWQFGILYITALVLSDLPTVAKHKEDYWYHSLGASGAISAVVFSFILFDPMASMRIIFIPFIPINAIIFGILYLVYCAYASKRANDSINHDAHFYGAIWGVIATICLVPGIIPKFAYIVSHQFGH